MPKRAAPSFDLTSTIAREHELVPDEVMRLASMLSYDERALLHWAARAGFGAAGSIVDAGCFLGGSTLALGHGLMKREAEYVDHASGATRIHSFDLFRVGEERERVYFENDFPYEIGASTIELFKRNIDPARSWVTIHDGDINQLGDWSEPIAVLFIDIAKAWQTNDTIVTQFFPHLVADAVVIQQDLVHYGHPWCALSMELLSDHFEFIGYVAFSSAVYRVISPVPIERAPTRLLERLSLDESLALIERCAERVGSPQEGYLRLAGATCALLHRHPEQARRIISGVASDYSDDSLPWVSEGIAYLSQLAAHVEAPCERSQHRNGYPEAPRPTVTAALPEHPLAPGSMIDFFQAGNWQMTAGERSALAGILSQLKPAVAIEVGSAEGGSLACVAAHAAEVHSFDLVAPSLGLEQHPNVTLHTGDSHELLPATLHKFEQENRNVDFALVDGDHTAEGVRRDVEDLLRSAAVSRTVILLHDTANEQVRAGIEAVDFDSFAKVRCVDLDFVPGYLVRADTFHHQIWGGLGLVLVDDSSDEALALHVASEIAYPITKILVEHRTRLDQPASEQDSHNAPPASRREIADLQARITDLEHRLGVVLESKSWRVTTPLRRLADRRRLP